MKWLVLLIVIGTIAFSYFNYRHEFTSESLSQRESQLKAYQEENPWLTYGTAYVAYTLVTALSLPFAVPMSLGYGKLLGFWPAMLVVSFGSTTGATLSFLFSRYLLRDWVQAKLGDRLEGFNQAWQREGPFYLFTLRLIPAVPFSIINLAMGLTLIRVWTYWWVSQLGMLAGTFVYIYAGYSLPSLAEATRGEGILTPQLLGAFLLLGLFPLIVRKLIGWLRAKRGR